MTLPRLIVLGTLAALAAVAGPRPARARTVTLATHDELLGALLRPAGGVTYRPSAALRGRGELQAAWVTVRNPSLLGSLTWLRRLSLHRCRVPGYGFLARLSALQALDLAQSDVRALPPLGALRALAEVDLSDTAVSDLGPLRGVATLRTLHLHGSRVTDLSPLRGRTLDRLTLGQAGMAVLPDLAGLAAVAELAIAGADRRVDLGPVSRARVARLVLDGLTLDGSALEGLAGATGLESVSLRGATVPLAAVRRLVRRLPQLAVVLPDGREAGRVLTFRLVPPDPRDYPCLQGGPPCARERFGPRRIPVYRHVEP